MIPIRVLFTLRISRIEKISIGLIFMVGLITMATGIIRTVSLNSAPKADGEVSTTWLILWAGIEGAVSIVVGCLPAFAIFVRTTVKNSRGYHSGDNNVALGSYKSGSSRTKSSNPQSANKEMPWEIRDNASDKSLVDDGILVTHSWSQRWHRAANS